MSKIKKLLSLLLVVAMTAGISAGVTVAYLQGTDENVNVMTLGNVSIEQLEYERVVENGAWVSTGETDKYGYTPDKLQEFKQNKPMYPAVFADGTIKWDDRNGSSAEDGTGHQQSWGQVGASGSNQLFDDSVKNVQDKFVFVKNTGKSDAYVRTLFAFEQGSVAAEEFKNVIMTNANKDHWSWETVACDVEIDGSTYLIMSATYLGPKSNPTGILASGAVSYPSLLQVYMKPEATNEDVEAIDGNQNGTYDILVLSQAVQTAGFADAQTALDTAFGDIVETDNGSALVAKWFEGAIADYEASLVDTWDGTYDTTWYNETDTEFTLTTAEQLAGLATLVDGGNTFAGKTVKLGIDMDFYCEGEGDLVSLQPIGSYAFEKSFSGIFDGQDHTVKNIYQNGWALESGLWDGDDCGLGLFGKVENATVKNLKMDGSSLPTECNLNGFVAGAAYGECVFEDITVTNSYSGNHSYYSGGIVGWASGNHKYINCDLDETNVISSQWGDFNNANGGIIGGAGKSGTYYFEDCDIACVLDSYNDVTSAYEWYAYRNTGMLIGNTGHTTTNDEGTTIAAAPNVTCKNVTVTYGDWANYHYCQFHAMNYPWVRVEAGESCHAYGNARYDYATDAEGNNVVDANHVHNDGEGHDVLLTVDQLFGGNQGGVYGNPSHEGVTVIYNNK